MAGTKKPVEVGDSRASSPVRLPPLRFQIRPPVSTIGA